ncbi:sigma-70 family RNA polymerase sigma factor [Roseomonas sp. GC11]|uniref:sigma-70 family RNA polymerase sigma factor n=1 Tax=Roseomonas sp. GC11 TaxID=2950546 RepID=UPI00210CC728|nr:sigma-70 family RNA polymerase sigma factor [Roseomonas sp. GC11]MCQ4161414.1 sigma-70 family RNA polymerase sigma factor [Roseomonas sp. GC11]
MNSVTPIEAEPTSAALVEGPSFHEQLVALLPRLRVQAVSMTRNRADADDLVQAAVSNALAAQHSFTPGTNFGAWMFRILRNRFLSDIRRRRDTCDMDHAPAEALARPAAQEDSLALRELRRRLTDLPEDHRTALLLVTVQGLSYEEAAQAMGCAVGTAKCRVFRARRQLEAWLMGEKPAPRRPAGKENRKEAGQTAGTKIAAKIPAGPATRQAQQASGEARGRGANLRGQGSAAEGRAMNPGL